MTDRSDETGVFGSKRPASPHVGIDAVNCYQLIMDTITHLFRIQRWNPQIKVDSSFQLRNISDELIRMSSRGEVLFPLNAHFCYPIDWPRGHITTAALQKFTDRSQHGIFFTFLLIGTATSTIIQRSEEVQFSADPVEMDTGIDLITLPESFLHLPKVTTSHPSITPPPARTSSF